MEKSLIQKYNISGPRYTSYPTVPAWSSKPNQESWKKEIKKTFDITNKSDGISLYIHLLFCESFCTYCGCNTRITKNHDVERPYIQLILDEWKLYINEFSEKPRITEIHLGGGTPTFFSPENLQFLIDGIMQFSEFTENPELSFEAHPNSTSLDHLTTLHQLGFRRLSLGIQDFDPVVQEVINRIQPFEIVDEVVKNARKVGYKSINFDLIYGLPLQTKESVSNTIDLVQKLHPDRIAFYSYAHVPKARPGQRKFDESDLPVGEEKRELYELGKEKLEAQGYKEIGLDHFALPNDDLYKAIEKKTLHRNFMGYTTQNSQLCIGLGPSSISDTWGAYSQNDKNYRLYSEKVSSGLFPIINGHHLTPKEEVTRKHILFLMCHLETDWIQESMQFDEIYQTRELLKGFAKDGLVELSEFGVKITEKGRPFVRNICMAFDPYILNPKKQNQEFSSTI